MREGHTFHAGINLSRFAQILFGGTGLADGRVERRAGEPARPERKGVTLPQFPLPDQPYLLDKLFCEQRVLRYRETINFNQGLQRSSYILVAQSRLLILRPAILID